MAWPLLRGFSRLFCVGAGLLVSACVAPPLATSDVSRFHALTPEDRGRSFAIVASDEKKRGGLEFEAYARLLAAELVRLGFVIEPLERDRPEIIVRLDYGIDSGKPVTTSYPDYVHQPGSFVPVHGVVDTKDGPRRYAATAFVPGRTFYAGTRVYTDPVYTATLSVEMIEREGGRGRLFEGRTVTISSRNQLPILAPAMVQAMLVDFPGASGVTYRIETPDTAP